MHNFKGPTSNSFIFCYINLVHNCLENYWCKQTFCRIEKKKVSVDSISNWWPSPILCFICMYWYSHYCIGGLRQFPPFPHCRCMTTGWMTCTWTTGWLCPSTPVLRWSSRTRTSGLPLTPYGMRHCRTETIESWEKPCSMIQKDRAGKYILHPVILYNRYFKRTSCDGHAW